MSVYTNRMQGGKINSFRLRVNDVTGVLHMIFSRSYTVMKLTTVLTKILKTKWRWAPALWHVSVFLLLGALQCTLIFHCLRSCSKIISCDEMINDKSCVNSTPMHLISIQNKHFCNTWHFVYFLVQTTKSNKEAIFVNPWVRWYNLITVSTSFWFLFVFSKLYWTGSNKGDQYKIYSYLHVVVSAHHVYKNTSNYFQNQLSIVACVVHRWVISCIKKTRIKLWRKAEKPLFTYEIDTDLKYPLLISMFISMAENLHSWKQLHRWCSAYWPLIG